MLIPLLLTFVLFIYVDAKKSIKHPSGRSRRVSPTRNLRGSQEDTESIETQYSELTNVWTASVTAEDLDWYASASSSSGEYLYAVVFDGYIWSSFTYGATWNSYLVLGTSYWSSVACSSDGTYVLVSSEDGAIYLSDSNAIDFSDTDCPDAQWMGVAMSSSGAIMAAVAYSENIYISVNYGEIWTPTTGTSNYDWRSIAMSSNGLYMTAVVYEGPIFQSSDYGSVFTVVAELAIEDMYWYDVTMSSTGQYAVAVGCPGYIYYTLNYGDTWTAASTLSESDQCWSSVATSQSGEYLLAVEDPGFIYLSSNFGLDWVPSDNAPADQYWTSVACSSTGQYAIATIEDGPVYLGTIAVPSDTNTPTSLPTVVSSNDYSWENVLGDGIDVAWTSVAADISGQYLVACASGYGVYQSDDYGDSWSTSTLSATTNLDWISVASSTDGSVLLVASISNGYVYVSTDFGATWDTSSDSADWISVAMSGSGDLMAAAAYYGGIYLSTDTGVTWGISSAPEPLYWSSVSISAQSYYMVATAINNYVYVSTDSGATWGAIADTPDGSYWKSSAVSQSGQYMLALALDIGIYYSLNYGVDWALSNAPIAPDWFAITSSSSGEIAAAVSYDGYLFVSNDYGQEWTICTDLGSSYWMSVASDGTGNMLIASAEDYGVYIGLNPAVPTYAPVAQPPTSVPTPTYQPTEVVTSHPTVVSSTSYSWSASFEIDYAWTSVATDSSGELYVACAAYTGIYTSQDGGHSWTMVFDVDDTNIDWSSVASSSNGSVLAAAAASDGEVYLSTDSGDTWVANTISANWISVCMSASGNLIVAAVYDGDVYMTNNYGAQWSVTNAPSPLYWTSVSMSIDNTYMLGTSADGYVYLSTDSGGAWAEITPLPDEYYWKTSAISSDGQYMLAASAEVGIYYSTNYGADWTLSNAPTDGYWSSVTSSTSGEIAAAVTYGGYAYVSNDYGATWEECTDLGTFYFLGVASDASGNVLVAAAKSYGVLVGVNEAVPSEGPTEAPVNGGPTVLPSLAPSKSPTQQPTVPPSEAPTKTSTPTITNSPSSQPSTQYPTSHPSSRPNASPTLHPFAGPTKRPNTHGPSEAPTVYPTSRPSSAPVQSTSLPTFIPTTTFTPTRSPSIQNSPIVTFSVNVTLTMLTSDVLDTNCQNAIIATTAYWMEIPSTAIIYIGSYPVPVVRRLEVSTTTTTTSSGNSSSTYSLIAVTQTSTSVANTAYSNYTNLYYESIKKLDTAVTNGDYTETLQIESQSDHYNAAATQSAVATLIDETLPTVVMEPSHEPTLSPTFSTAPGEVESIGTITPGVLLFILVLSILYLREPYTLALNELNSWFGEVCDAAIKCLIVVLSINLIAEYSVDTHSPSFLLMVFSKLALFILWFFFIIAFFFPVRTVDGKRRVQLALLLHKETFKIKLAFSVYGLLVTMSMFDLTFLRLMPWIRTTLTDSMQGYPNTFMIRCCLYGTFLSHMIQSLAIIIRIAFENKDDGHGTTAQQNQQKAYLLLAFSVFNVFRAFISMLFVVRVAQSDKLKLAVVNESDVAVLADFMRKTEFQEPRETSIDDNSSAGGNSKNSKKGFTPGRISTMLFTAVGYRSSTLSAPTAVTETTENPINKDNEKATDANKDKGGDRDESFLMSPSETSDTLACDSEDWEQIEGADGVPHYRKKTRTESFVSDVTGDTEVDDRGIRFSANTKFADQTLEILRSQLKKEGKIPVEFIPLADLKAEIAIIFSKANNGVPYDEGRLDYLLMCMDYNPDYL